MRAQTAWVLCAGMILSACSGAHPVLYDNTHLQTVGKDAADQDIEACKEAAESAGAEEGSGKAGRVAACANGCSAAASCTSMTTTDSMRRFVQRSPGCFPTGR